MAVYEFICRKCGTEFEVTCHMDERDARAVCSKYGSHEVRPGFRWRNLPGITSRASPCTSRGAQSHAALSATSVDLRVQCTQGPVAADARRTSRHATAAHGSSLEAEGTRTGGRARCELTQP